MDPIIGGGLLKLGGALIDRLFPDKEARDRAKLALFELEQRGELAHLEAETKLALGQIEVNKVEAQAGPYRGGWRPFIGWTCGAGLAYQFVLHPLLGWAAAWQEVPLPPSLNIDELIALLFGMLGLGAYRSWEKVRKLP